jgi:hypothetical protein
MLETQTYEDDPSPNASSNPPTSNPSPSPETLHDDSISYLLQLACECHVRGGFTLADSIALHRAKQQLEQPPPPDDALPGSSSNNEAARTVERYVLQAQRLGTMSLHEAWSAYNALKLVERHRSTDT